MMLSTKGLLIGAAAMQLALVGAAATPVAPVNDDVGRGFWEGLACAGCAVGGLVFVAGGGLEATAITLTIGGSSAVAFATVATGCIRACVTAF